MVGPFDSFSFRCQLLRPFSRLSAYTWIYSNLMQFVCFVWKMPRAKMSWWILWDMQTSSSSWQISSYAMVRRNSQNQKLFMIGFPVLTFKGEQHESLSCMNLATRFYASAGLLWASWYWDSKIWAFTKESEDVKTYSWHDLHQDTSIMHHVTRGNNSECKSATGSHWSLTPGLFSSESGYGEIMWNHPPFKGELLWKNGMYIFRRFDHGRSANVPWNDHIVNEAPNNNGRSCSSTSTAAVVRHSLSFAKSSTGFTSMIVQCFWQIIRNNKSQNLGVLCLFSLSIRSIGKLWKQFESRAKHLSEFSKDPFPSIHLAVPGQQWTTMVLWSHEVWATEKETSHIVSHPRVPKQYILYT